MIAAAAAALLLSAGAAPAATWLGPKPPAVPKRIATLAPSLTETVLALGLGDRLVGVSRYDDLPEVAKLPRLGGMMDPSAEAVLGVKPDIILAQPSPASDEVLHRLAELGVPVLELPMSSISDVLDAERAVGAALGAPKEGEALANALRSHLEETSHRLQATPRRRVLLVYGWEPLVVAGPGSFADELLKAAGADNAASAAKSAYATYSVEAAAAAHPEVIVDATFDQPMPAALKSLPGLSGARLVKPASLALLHPGPSLSRGLDELAAAVHPELSRQSSTSATSQEAAKGHP